jgi:hypothetical protein
LRGNLGRVKGKEGEKMSKIKSILISMGILLSPLQERGWAQELPVPSREMEINPPIKQAVNDLTPSQQVVKSLEEAHGLITSRKSFLLNLLGMGVFFCGATTLLVLERLIAQNNSMSRPVIQKNYKILTPKKFLDSADFIYYLTKFSRTVIPLEKFVSTSIKIMVGGCIGLAFNLLFQEHRALQQIKKKIAGAAQAKTNPLVQRALKGVATYFENISLEVFITHKERLGEEFKKVYHSLKPFLLKKGSLKGA